MAARVRCVFGSTGRGREQLDPVCGLAPRLGPPCHAQPVGPSPARLTRIQETRRPPSGATAAAVGARCAAASPPHGTHGRCCQTGCCRRRRGGSSGTPSTASQGNAGRLRCAEERPRGLEQSYNFILRTWETTTMSSPNPNSKSPWVTWISDKLQYLADLPLPVHIAIPIILLVWVTLSARGLCKWTSDSGIIMPWIFSILNSASLGSIGVWKCFKLHQPGCKRV